MQDLARLLLLLLVIFAILQETVDARGGRRGAKGKGKNNLQFAQVAEFSLIQSNLSDPKAAHVTKGSHFSQTFRLGYKLLIICEAKGEPRPTIKWYKEGSEINPKPNIHVSSVVRAIIENAWEVIPLVFSSQL
ncbi:hypothetical protein WR25_17760 isoform B [Diploscapter pachys]|uniref:Ig-like domain-containing protein n=1 Tax=Diploscapter pachys TaxID=2018661 RepID=A0A2A2LPR6_9BILA|nr:hypothetical protein WR25_17760 isoform B [Diploscapter pachys]